mmetsp:Transcript_135361/g.420633  ORF Transcript_135361/g.420633 Transcript_135361/m.420633 type:complete len:212 (-) Transcript_135361:264-899(-)
MTQCLLETMFGTSGLSSVKLQDFGFRPITKSPLLGTCTTSLVCAIRWTMHPHGWQLILTRFLFLAAASRTEAQRRRPVATTWDCASAGSRGGSPKFCATVSARWSCGSRGCCCGVACGLGAPGPRRRTARTVPWTSTRPHTSLCHRSSAAACWRHDALAFFAPLTKTVSSMLMRSTRRPTRSPTETSFSGRHCLVLILATSAPCAKTLGRS